MCLSLKFGTRFSSLARISSSRDIIEWDMTNFEDKPLPPPPPPPPNLENLIMGCNINHAFSFNQNRFILGQHCFGRRTKFHKAISAIEVHRKLSIGIYPFTMGPVALNAPVLIINGFTLWPVSWKCISIEQLSFYNWPVSLNAPDSKHFTMWPVSWKCIGIEHWSFHCVTRIH